MLWDGCCGGCIISEPCGHDMDAERGAVSGAGFAEEAVEDCACSPSPMTKSRPLSSSDRKLPPENHEPPSAP